MSDSLDRVLAHPERPFAILHRPYTTGPAQLEVLTGEVSTVASLADLEAGDPSSAGPRTLALIPHRQVAERGLECVDDGAPLIALRVSDHAVLPKASVLERLPEVPISLAGTRFDVDDSTYAELVRRVVTEEIGTGEGANFVIRRSFLAEIEDYDPRHAFTFFRRLCEQESGAYWTFLVHTGDRTFVGATPERHVSLDDGLVTMNPISGTYRYPPAGPTLSGVLDFLSDHKETDELYMVLDEELKMMSRICDRVRVIGPRLKEMARLAHTEYLIEGDTRDDVRDILRETLFAPTVTGSPVENACRVIARHERVGRGYYGGVAALIGRDTTGRQTMDSAILIRTAAINPSGGGLEIGVGATLVRHSDPVSEVAETRVKLAALLGALTERPVRWQDHSEVQAALSRRNTRLGAYWFGEHAPRFDGSLTGRRALVIDAEDTFTSMIAQQLRSLGLDVTVRRFDEDYSTSDHDVVVLGPGPGDPRATDHPKIAHLRGAVRSLLRQEKPFLAVCLSHQVLCRVLGFELVRRDVPSQGEQRRIPLFGRQEVVGFYNTFAARSGHDRVDHPIGPVEVSRDADTGEVHALRGNGFASVQFHPESVLTADGPAILGRLLAAVLPVPEAWAS